MFLLRVPSITVSTILGVIFIGVLLPCRSAPRDQAAPSQSTTHSYPSHGYRHYGHGYHHYGRSYHDSHRYHHYGQGYDTSSGGNPTGIAAGGTSHYGRHRYYRWRRDASGHIHYYYSQHDYETRTDSAGPPENPALYGPSRDLEEPLSRRDRAEQEQKMRAAKTRLAQVEQRLARQRHQRHLQEKAIAAKVVKTKVVKAKP